MHALKSKSKEIAIQSALWFSQMMRAISRVAIAAIVFCCVSTSLYAQFTSGTIVGIVYDPSGAAVANCTVTAKDVATGAVRTVTTDASGYYTMPSLMPDSYELTATASGFTVATSQITLTLNQTLNFDFHLKVGSIRQSVVVNTSSSTLALETESHQVGDLLTAHTIENLPANGRDLFQTLQSGTNISPFQNAPGPIANFKTTGNSLTIGGSASGMTSYLEDGVSNYNLLTKTTNLQPSIESVQEVNLTQSGASARFDQPSVVNVITKNGTNQFHGRAYDYVRSDALDTVGYFKVPKPSLSYNQFGANIGGPIVRNKLFFFFDYAGLRESQGVTLFADVPTAAESQGNFSQDPYTIYDPSTYNPQTGTISPFPNNIIPASRISPFATKFLAYYPQPTGSAIPNLNFQKNVADTRTYNSYLGRIDYNIGSRDTAYGAFETINPSILQPSFSPNSIFTYLNVQTARNGYVQETHTFNPNLLNIVRFGYNYSDIFYSTVGTGSQDFVKEFGLQNLNPVPAQYVPPAVSLVTHSGLGNPTSPQGAIQDLYQYEDELDWVRGKHNIYVGGTLDKIDFNGNWTVWNSGQYTFTGQYTSNHNTAKLAGGGDLADLLLGFPTVAEGGTGVTIADFREWNVLPYMQDNWRISSRLTLNLGLRYDYFGSPNDANGRSNIYQPSTNTNHRGTFHQNYFDFAPRVGFAYSITDNTVMHGGYGIYYSQFSYNQLQFLMINPPNYYLQLNTYNISTLTPVTDTFVSNPTTSGLAPFTVALDMPVPAVQQWNLSFQRSIGSDWIATLSYLGNKSTHMQIRDNPNQASLPSNPSHPSPIQSRRPYPWVGDVYQVSAIAYGNYNGLEAELERRFSRGLSVLTSYVWSKSLDSLNNGAESPEFRRNVALEYGLSDFNAAQVFKFSAVYNLPLGAGKTYLSSNNWFNKQVIGGWQVSDILTVQSGLPFNVGAVDLSDTGGFHAQRANRICNGNHPAQQSITHWFNTACYVQPGVGQLGTEGRDDIIGPRTTNLNLSLFKEFPLTKDKLVQFRSDFFDALNHPLLGIPNAFTKSPVNGQITNITGARDIQLSLKLIY